MSITADELTDDQRTLVNDLRDRLLAMINERLCPDTISYANVALHALANGKWQYASDYIDYTSYYAPEWEVGCDQDQNRFRHAKRLAELHDDFKNLFSVT